MHNEKRGILPVPFKIIAASAFAYITYLLSKIQ